MRTLPLPRTDREAHFPHRPRRLIGNLLPAAMLASTLLLPFRDAKARNIEPLMRAFGVDSELALPVRAQRTILGAEEVMYRQLDTINYQNGDYAAPVRIPRGDLLQYLVLYVSGNLSKTESVAGTLDADAPATFLTSIDITGDGDTFYSLPGEWWTAFAAYHFGRYPSFTNITLGTDVSEFFEQYYVIPFESYRSIKPWDTVLRTDLFKQELTLRVKFGASTAATIPDLIHGGTYTAVAFTTAPTVQVYAVYARNPGFVPAFFTRTRRSIYGYAAAGDVRHDFLEDTTVRLIGIKTRDDNGARDDVTDVTLETNSGVFNARNLPDAVLREDQYLHNSNVQTFRAGWNFWDFAQNGLLRRSLVTRLVSNPRLTTKAAFGGVGTRQLEVVALELYRPSGLVELQSRFAKAVRTK